MMTEPETMPDDAGGGAMPPPLSRGPEAPPAVIVWYRVYCAGMAVVYLLFLLLGLFMLLAPALLVNLVQPARGELMAEQAGNMVVGLLYALMGLFFFMVYLAGAFLPARNWSWVAGLVLIALSFTSCCCLPAAIPLLLFWIKPETKAWFRTGSDGAGSGMPG